MLDFFVSRSLTTSLYRSGVGNDSSFVTEFNSWFHVMTINVSLRSTKNRFGLHCHPSLSLMVETRPILLEDHLCGLRLVQGDPVLRWIFWKT